MEKHSILTSRSCQKAIVMIIIYGGKCEVHKKGFKKYFNNIITQKSILITQMNFTYTKLFYYIENHFQAFQKLI